MNNLGAYKTVTTLIKKAGGPEAAAKLVVLAGGLVFTAGGFTYAGLQKATPVVRRGVAKLLEKVQGGAARRYPIDGTTYTVDTAASDEDGPEFAKGATFTVLERDEDAVLIALDGSDNNPWFVSATFLAQISDFPG